MARHQEPKSGSITAVQNAPHTLSRPPPPTQCAWSETTEKYCRGRHHGLENHTKGLFCARSNCATGSQRLRYSCDGDNLATELLTRRLAGSVVATNGDSTMRELHCALVCAVGSATGARLVEATPQHAVFRIANASLALVAPIDGHGVCSRSLTKKNLDRALKLKQRLSARNIVLLQGTCGDHAMRASGLLLDWLAGRLTTVQSLANLRPTPLLWAAREGCNWTVHGNAHVEAYAESHDCRGPAAMHLQLASSPRRYADQVAERARLLQEFRSNGTLGILIGHAPTHFDSWGGEWDGERLEIASGLGRLATSPFDSFEGQALALAMDFQLKYEAPDDVKTVGRADPFLSRFLGRSQGSLRHTNVSSLPLRLRIAKAVAKRCSPGWSLTAGVMPSSRGAVASGAAEACLSLNSTWDGVLAEAMRCTPRRVPNAPQWYAEAEAEAAAQTGVPLAAVEDALEARPDAHLLHGKPFQDKKDCLHLCHEVGVYDPYWIAIAKALETAWR